MGLFGNKQEFETTTKMGNVKIDEPRRLFKVNLTIYPIDDLVSFELLENGSQVTSGGISLGRAALGGVAFGAVGAGIGGLTKVKKQDTEFCNSLKVIINLKNQKRGTAVINLIAKKTKKSSFMYSTALTAAKSTLEGLNYILGLQGVQDTDPNLDKLEDIKKYKELLDLGIIDQSEFDKKKKELLNL